jgi:hypothetical protein
VQDDFIVAPTLPYPKFTLGNMPRHPYLGVHVTGNQAEAASGFVRCQSHHCIRYRMKRPSVVPPAIVRVKSLSIRHLAKLERLVYLAIILYGASCSSKHYTRPLTGTANVVDSLRFAVYTIWSFPTASSSDHVMAPLQPARRHLSLQTHNTSLPQHASESACMQHNVIAVDFSATHNYVANSEL